VGLNRTELTDEEFFGLKPRKVLPDTVSVSEISDREFFGLAPVAPENTALPISQEEKVEVGLLDTPLPITLGGSTLGQISIRQALKVAEPILGVFEVPIELMRQKFRDASVIRNKIKSGKLPSIGDVSNVFFGNPKTLIDAIKKVPKTGAVFRELTKPDGISKEDRFSDFSEVLEEIGVPEGPNISPFERFPVSLRGAAGFGLEMLAPTIPVAKGAKAVKGLVRKSAKEVTKEIIPKAKDIIPGAQATKQTPAPIAPEGQKVASKPIPTSSKVIVPETVVDDAKVAILDKSGKVVTGRPEAHHSQIHERLFVEERTNIRPGIDDASDITGWEYKGQFISIKDLEKTKGDFQKAFQNKFDKLKLQSKSVSTSEFIKKAETSAPPLKIPDIKEADDILSPEFTRAAKADMARDREILNLDTLSSPETVTFEATLKSAKAKGFDKVEKTDALADEVLGRFKKNKLGLLTEEVKATPRAFNPEETSGMVLRAVELKNTHKALNKAASKLPDNAPDTAILAAMERIQEEFDRISEALRRSGERKGQALVFQKLTLNQDFDLVSVRNRAQIAKKESAKGAALTNKETAKFKELTDKLAKRDEELAEALKRNNKRSANALLVSGVKKFEKMTPIQKRQAFDDAFEKAKKLIDEGCVIGG